MTDLQEKAMRMALETLEHIHRCIGSGSATIHWDSATWHQSDATIEALRQSLAQSEQEPVAWVCGGQFNFTKYCDDCKPLYSAPVDTVNTSQERVDETAKSGRKHIAVERMMRWVKVLKSFSDNGRYPRIPSGMTAGACYELAEELEQFIKTAPPKREWKGLTSDDKHFLLANAWNNEQAFDGFMDAIDKFLEEKNT